MMALMQFIAILAMDQLLEAVMIFVFQMHAKVEKNLMIIQKILLIILKERNMLWQEKTISRLMIMKYFNWK